jgi:DNA-binding NarL/FixJ family response regulator
VPAGSDRLPRVKERIRVLAVDDQEVVTWGLRVLLARLAWVERCLQATDSERALVLVRRYEPHVALIDLALGAASGAELSARVHAASPATRVLLMSSGPSVPARTIEAARASGYVSKQWTVEEIIAAVRVTALGMAVTNGRHADLPVPLTRREEDVLTQIARGATNDEIAHELKLSLYTVKQHASAAYRKLQARNRTDAVERARRLGLLA